MQFVNTFHFYEKGNQPIRKYPSRLHTLSDFETGNQGNTALLKSRWPVKNFNCWHPPIVTSSRDLTPETTFVFHAFIQRKVSSHFASNVLTSITDSPWFEKEETIHLPVEKKEIWTIMSTNHQMSTPVWSTWRFYSVNPTYYQGRKEKQEKTCGV